MSIGQLIEDLCIANVKLYEICDMKKDIADNPENYTKRQMADVMAKDIQLCQRRAQLKTSIDRTLESAIIDGRLDVVDEVKSYGN